MSAAQLFSWGACAVYIGPAFGLTPHRNAAVVIAAGLDGPFKIALKADIDNGCYHSCRTALIPPDTTTHLMAIRGTMGFIYVDANSEEYARLRHDADRAAPRLDAVRERQLIALLRLLRSQGARSWPGIREKLRTALGREGGGRRDPRIDRALEILHSQPSTRPSLARLSSSVGLSASRFIHLFKAQTGVPFRRYKRWVAMGAAVRAISSGEDLTTASAGAGFATPSHFSAAFRDMFGMVPSRLVGVTLTKQSSRENDTATRPQTVT